MALRCHAGAELPTGLRPDGRRCRAADTIESLTKARGVRIALLYDEWFEYDASGKVPTQWVKVGEWKIPRNVVCRM